MKKNRGGFLNRLGLDGQGVPIGRFGKKVDFESVNLMGPVHLERSTIQNPFDVLDIVYVMVDIDIGVTHLIKLLRFRPEKDG